MILDLLNICACVTFILHKCTHMSFILDKYAIL